MDSKCSPSVSPDAGRGSRTRKKISQIICPICGVTVRSQEIESHFALEMQRLEKTSTTGTTKIRKERSHEADEASTSSDVPAPLRSPSSSGTTNKESAWGTYQKIKTNRQTRLKTKSRKRKSIENICPVCNRLTSEDIHVHVEKCLNRSEKRPRTSTRKGSEGDNDDIDNDDDEDEDSIDIVGEEHSGDTYEEYEWAGQTRIRASSLITGGYASTGIGSNSLTNTTITAAENDEDLNVDGDDTQIFGPSQYSEKDVIPPAQSLEADKYLRSLIAGDSPSKAAAASSSSSPFTSSATALAQTGTSKVAVDNGNVSDALSTDSNDREISSPLSMQGQILESLKARLKEYEQQSSTRDKTKCQICMDEYKSPCVSICCWHVHCEECWLRSLGSRKLCPKCNMITSATDLRRIYL